MPRPLVSIIVPTYQRALLLPYLFDALAKQVYPHDRIEVLVVDNSSTDNTEAVVSAWSARLPFRVSFYRRPNRGPAVSRNYAAGQAHGTILAFTDSDCVPSPGWLQAGVRGLEDDVGLVGGPIVPVRQADEPGLLSAALAPSLEDRGLYPTANLFVRRALFQAIGGFDEAFGVLPWGDLVGGEDTDFGWRIRRTGAQARFVDAARVGHITSRVGVRDWLLRPFRLQVLPRLVRTAPELRRTHLWLRYFNSKEHGYFQLFWLSLAGAAIFRSPLPLPAALPYLVRQRRVALDRVKAGQPGRAIAAFAFTSLRHALETAVLAGSSLRYRRLVL